MSEKLYDLSARVDALVAGAPLFGPWTAFSPLSNGWAVRSPWGSAWVRAAPGNMAVLAVHATPGDTTDGTVIGTVPSADSAGNGLRPAQDVTVPAWADLLGTDGASGKTEGAYLRVASNGQVTCHGLALAATALSVAAGWYPLDSM